VGSRSCNHTTCPRPVKWAIRARADAHPIAVHRLVEVHTLWQRPAPRGGEDGSHGQDAALQLCRRTCELLGVGHVRHGSQLLMSMCKNLRAKRPCCAVFIGKYASASALSVGCSEHWCSTG
jgi:hypothetical protein